MLIEVKPHSRKCSTTGVRKVVVYVVVSKSSKTRPTYNKVLTRLKFGHCPLQNSPLQNGPLVQQYSTPSGVTTAGTRSGSVVLEACQAPAIHTESPPRSQNGDPSAATGPIGSPCCYGRETCVMGVLSERVHCRHEASNCPHATVQAVSTERPASNA